MRNLRIKLPDMTDPSKWMESLDTREFDYVLLQDPTISRRFNHSGTALLAHMPLADTVEIVLPARVVRLLKVKLPRAKASALQRVLPNLLEDRLMSDSSDCHFALLPGIYAGGEREVAVVDRTWMRLARHISQRWPGSRSVCISEALLVPVVPFIVLDMPGQKNASGSISGFIRHTDGVLPFTTDAQHLPVELQLLRPALESSTSLGLAGASPALCQAWTDELGQALEPSDWNWRHATVADPAMTLFQCEFARNATPAGDWQRVWRWPMFFAAACGLAGILGLNLHWLKLEREANALRARMSADFRTLLPGMSDRGEPLLMAKRQLGRQQGDDHFLVLSQALAQATLSSGTQALPPLKRLDYRNGILKAELHATQNAVEVIQRLQSQRELEVRTEGNLVIVSRRAS